MIHNMPLLGLPESTFNTLTALPDALPTGIQPDVKALNLYIASRSVLKFTPGGLPIVAPWQGSVLRQVLTEDGHVLLLSEALDALAAAENLTMLPLGDVVAKINDLMATSDGHNWTLMGAAAAPVKRLARTILTLQNLEHQLILKGPKNTKTALGLLLQLPYILRDNTKLPVVRPSFAFYLPGWPADAVLAKVTASIDSVNNYMGDTELAKQLVGGEGLAVSAAVGAMPPAPPVATVTEVQAAKEVVSSDAQVAAKLAALKTVLIDTIRSEVKLQVLSGKGITAAVEQWLVANPSQLAKIVQAQLASGNPTIVALLKAEAQIAVKGWLTTDGTTHVEAAIQSTTASLVDKEALKQQVVNALSMSIDGYMASVFDRVVVRDAGGVLIGQLDFKDQTTLQAPVPGHTLATIAKSATTKKGKV